MIARVGADRHEVNLAKKATSLRMLARKHPERAKAIGVWNEHMPNWSVDCHSA